MTHLGCVLENLLIVGRNLHALGGALKAVKALMKTIPDEQFADLAAYWSSVR